MTINESIRKCRTSRGITQKEIAERLGIPRPFVTQIENGERKIPVERLIQLADIFGCTLDELVGRNVDVNGKEVSA